MGICRSSPTPVYEPYIYVPLYFSYDDDEQLPVREISESMQTYDLKECLKIKITPLYENIKSLTLLPCMLEVTTDDFTGDPIKPGIDLVCVVDTSMSMYGENIQTVVKTLERLIQFLTPNDRLSIVRFSDIAFKLSNLCRVTPENQPTFERAFKHLRPWMDNYISKGIREALTILKHRKEINQVTSIFLLSDGVDDSLPDLKNILETEDLESEYTINTFGFGSFHDPKVLSEIAKLGGGKYYFVDNIQLLDGYFIEALGGLMSVVGQNLSVKIEPSEGFPIKIAKGYGDGWDCGHHSTYYSQQWVVSGQNRKSIFEIEIQPTEDIDNESIDNESISLLTYHTTVQNIFSRQEYLIENELILDQQKDQKPNMEIQNHHFRVRVAKVLQESMTLNQQEKYAEAQQLIWDMIDQIKATPQLISFENQIKLLEKALESCNSQKFAAQERILQMMAGAVENNSFIQYCQEDLQEVQDQQCNQLQKNMLTRLKELKSEEKPKLQQKK